MTLVRDFPADANVSDHVRDQIRRDQAQADERGALIAPWGRRAGSARAQVPEIIAALKARSPGAEE